MMRPARVALVGCGVIGGLHASALAASSRATLAAVVDPAAARDAFAARFSVPGYAELEQLLGSERLDACIVAVPDALHLTVTARVLEHGIPVLLEKPMAGTLAAALDLAALAHRTGVRLMIGQVLRFDPRYMEAAERVHAGQIGELLTVQAGRWGATREMPRLSDTSPTFHIGIHDIDAIHWLTGSFISWVDAVAAGTHVGSKGHLTRSVLALGRLHSGAAVQVHAGWVLPEGYRGGLRSHLELTGTAGILRIGNADTAVAFSDEARTTALDTVAWPSDVTRSNLAAELDHFLECLGDEREFGVPLDSAVAAVAVAEAIDRAVATQRRQPVELPSNWAFPHRIS